MAAALSGQEKQKTRGALSLTLRYSNRPGCVEQLGSSQRQGTITWLSQLGSDSPAEESSFSSETHLSPPQGCFALPSTCSQVLQWAIWPAMATELGLREKPGHEVRVCTPAVNLPRIAWASGEPRHVALCFPTSVPQHLPASALQSLSHRGRGFGGAGVSSVEGTQRSLHL